jgi:hypothetical protein
MHYRPIVNTRNGGPYFPRELSLPRWSLAFVVAPTDERDARTGFVWSTENGRDAAGSRSHDV